jgi:hypothetical protein
MMKRLAYFLLVTGVYLIGFRISFLQNSGKAGGSYD